MARAPEDHIEDFKLLTPKQIDRDLLMEGLAEASVLGREWDTHSEKLEQPLSERGSVKNSESALKDTKSNHHDFNQSSDPRQTSYHRDSGKMQHEAIIPPNSITGQWIQGDSVKPVELENKVKNTVQVPLDSTLPLPNFPTEPSFLWKDPGSQMRCSTDQNRGTPLMPSYGVEREAAGPRTPEGYHQSSIPDIQHNREFTPIDPGAAKREVNAAPIFEKEKLKPESKALGRLYNLSHSRSSSAPTPVEREETPDKLDGPPTFLSRHRREPSDVPEETKNEVNEHLMEVDYEDEDCGSSDDESIDGDLTRFERIRMGLGGSEIPYDYSDQTVAPLVTHRPLAALSAERQKEIVEEFPSLNGTVSIPRDGLGQKFTLTDRTFSNGICAVLWEEEATICLVVELSGIAVTRRCDNNMINGTKLLNSAIVSRGRRDGILKGERVRHVVKVGDMEFKGVWIPFERALEMARREQVLEHLYPLFIADVASILYSPSNCSRLQQLLNKGSHKNPKFLNWLDGLLVPKDATSINSSLSWSSSTTTKS